MRSVEVVGKEYVSISEVYAALKKVKDEDRNYEQKLTWEHVSKFKKLSVSDVKKLRKELEELDLRRLKEEHVTQIIDILPRNVKELKLVLEPMKINVHEDEYKKISEVVSKYVK